ncbi:MAG TPA: MFS transporter [Saprospirales bacterium]|nr:MFS transporter [Saprospirales bacterium]HAY71306.1 MFS transporter [Saprospirales bacterium]
MNKRKISMMVLTPVLFSFFVMSFCDLVGIGVDRVKLEFGLSNTMVQLIPSAVFIWFFILSVPVGVFQDRFGKKNVVNTGMFITALGMLIPYFFYTKASIFLGFALLGIGNTILQVSANPLLVDVVPSEKKSSFLSFSQFIKSIGSMVAPFIASFLAAQYGDWKLMFLAFGIISILAAVWLNFTKVEETRNTAQRATIASSLKLLGTPFITYMVLGIFLVVGIDVGINAISGQFLMNKFDSVQEFAEKGRSVYFFGKMLGTFAGAIMLAMLASRKFLLWSSILGLLSIIALLFATGEYMAMVIIFIIGLGVANIFPLIFSLTVDKYPLRANEISGLMVMAISGGAIIPPIIGYLTDVSGITAGMLVLVACGAYLLFLAAFNLMKKQTA